MDIRSAVDELKWVEFASRPEEGEALSPTGRQRILGADDEVSSAPRAGHVQLEHNGRVIADFDLPIGKIGLGRATSNDVRIDSQFVSRHHCQILTTAHYSVIEDLQSQNGIIVGNRRVSVHRLKDGDRVVIGEHALVYTVSQRMPSAKVSLFPLVLPQKAPAVESGPTRILQLRPAVTQTPDSSAD